MTFLDTSAWLAALNPRDPRHAAASRAYEDSVSRRVPLLTTNLVVAEMHSLLTRARGATQALRFLDQLYDDPSHEVVWATRDLERRAVDRWLRAFTDHQFSLADAVSFQLMRERGMQTAFAFDRHFAIAGFRLVPNPG
jgi:predicted nucleic acid-binding protein